MPPPTPHVYHFDCVGSTNDEAKRLSAEHPEQAVLVIAQQQAHGRGSHGRAWRSPLGGAWFSLGVTLPKHEPAISLIVGEALREVLAAHVPTVTVKRPNDLLVDGKKLAGILCEQTVTPGKPEVAAVIGIGINANFPAAELGTELRTPPTSLLDVLGHEVDLESLISQSAEAVLRRLASI